jgi:hypothetical protein
LTVLKRTNSQVSLNDKESEHMADSAEPHKKTKLEELDTTAPYADRTEDPTATAILRKKKKPNVCQMLPTFY